MTSLSCLFFDCFYHTNWYWLPTINNGFWLKINADLCILWDRNGMMDDMFVYMVDEWWLLIEDCVMIKRVIFSGYHDGWWLFLLVIQDEWFLMGDQWWMWLMMDNRWGIEDCMMIEVDSVWWLMGDERRWWIILITDDCIRD